MYVASMVLLKARGVVLQSEQFGMGQKSWSWLPRGFEALNVLMLACRDTKVYQNLVALPIWEFLYLCMG
jgi:hypothetical protein